MKRQLSRRHAAIPAILIALALPATPLTAGQHLPGWLGGGDKDVKYATYKDPVGRFEIEYPAKDWRVLPSAGSTLAGFSGKDNAALFIEAPFKMADALTPAELEALPEIELAALKKQQPGVKEFTSDMVDSRSGRGVLIRYSRATGETEAVRQYSIPVGKDLYRLNGVVPSRLLAKNEPIIVHMIQSFQVGAGPAATQPR
jgi:hypothetical protein